MDSRRTHALRSGVAGTGPVLYWMHREHRAQDNWSLVHAQQMALARNAPLAAVWCLASSHLDACLRQFSFLLRGMAEVERELASLRIPLFVLQGRPGDEVAALAHGVGAGVLVTDFDPVRVKRQWLGRATESVSIPVWETDARNVVPCRTASDKREYAARTLRPKISRLLPEFLEEIPRVQPHPVVWPGPMPRPADWAALEQGLDVDRSVTLPAWIEPGPKAARRALDAFVADRLARYGERNDPNAGAVSRLSPYLHFGMLSAQRAALAVAGAGHAPETARESFLEELIVRRELADNFCLHTPGYDTVEAFPAWARATLEKHRRDPRPRTYAAAEMEQGRTDDPLWNAAQREMVEQGTMHGYMRMYWAKKILEWTPSPEEALRRAVWLNDRYQLDGRDPNGYAGIAWSLGGVHDRPWGERPVFGTIRYMSARGCASKFDVRGYVERMLGLGALDASG